MKNYPAKSKKRKKPNQEQTRFDKSELTSADREVLKQFKERRKRYDDLLEESNIIHHKNTCPVCGFPTISNRGDYEACIICSWEDDGRDDENDSSRHLPNYLSLVQHRVNIAIFMEHFEKKYIISNSIDEIIKDLKSFEEKLSKGVAEVDLNFENNLKNILPTKANPSATIDS
jgi:Cysteine-rich CPCC